MAELARGSKAFTLVEVLVVLAIVGVLTAIVTASTVKGIAMAKSSTCASNLRQIDLAAEMYSTANDGYWPPTAMVASGEPEPEAVLFKAEIAPYGASNGIFFCPLDPHVGDASNVYVFGPEDQTSYCELGLFLFAGKQLSRGPIESYLVQDTEIVDGSTCGTLHDRGFPTDPAGYLHGSPYATGHGDVENVVFLDGHVKLFPDSEASFVPTTAGCLAKGR